MTMTPRALISVTDKTGVDEFAKGLVDLGFSILSTGGTYRALQEAGVPVQQVADYTGFPEIMGGRVKTLHPRIHGGLLGLREDPQTQGVMEEHGIDPIDVVAVNLYRFRETASREGVADDEVIENIDIGGPSMIRSAAKNHAHVTIVVDPTDYGRVLDALRDKDATGLGELRGELAGKAYAHTADYDTAIAAWFARRRGEEFTHHEGFSGEKIQDLRYGENPHQGAAFYRFQDGGTPSLAAARQVGGKELSYNNILDLDAALCLALEFEQPACVVVKHNNPCGTAVADTTPDALRAAVAADPVSAFGGIVALSRKLDKETAVAMVEEGSFFEAVIAPEIDEGALLTLQQAKWGKNLRALVLGGWPVATDPCRFRQVSGGFLAQSPDAPVTDDPEMKAVTDRAPSDDEQLVLSFAWKVAKHVKSNAIVLARRNDDGSLSTSGVGAGQMSRVDSVELAVKKVRDGSQGAVLASDAFFPFADGIEAAAAAGVTAVIQPGGSRRDDEVISAADAAGIAMVFTGTRHFRH